MKKSLLISILFTMSCHIFANMQQTGWRWRADNGNETTATWLANDTVGITISDTTTIIRLRVRIDNAGDGNKTTTGLMYSATKISGDNGKVMGNDAALTAIPDTWNASSPFIFAASTNVADGTATTTVPILYVNSKAEDEKPNWFSGIVVSKNQSVTVTKDFHTEIEYCIKPTKYLTNGTYYFLPGGAEIEIYQGQHETMAKLVVDLPTSSNVLAESKITISNPVSDFMRIKNLPDENGSISIINMSGQVVKRANISSASNYISVSDLQNGMYIVEVNCADKIVRQKIVKK